MIVLVVLALVVGLGASTAVTFRLLKAHEIERNTWTAERKFLLNRAMARDFGEVVAMERDPQPPREHAYVPPVEGM